MLKNPDQLIPYNIEDFLSVGENKEVLFDLIKRSIEEKPLSNRIVFFYSRQCTRITENGSEVVDALKSDHEEADTKLVAYASIASNFSSGMMIRSPSGDIDIAILLVCHTFRCNLYLDNGTNKNRRIYDLNGFSLPDQTRSALLGVHAFSGNDYVSCFFRKGKKTCWNRCLKNSNFISTFANLGLSLGVSTEEQEHIEKYVCTLYGQKKSKNTKEARCSIFWDRYNKKGEICELSMLSPCTGNLKFHLRRSNYVAFIYRHSDQLLLNLPAIEDYGWTSEAGSRHSLDGRMYAGRVRGVCVER